MKNSKSLITALFVLLFLAPLMAQTDNNSRKEIGVKYGTSFTSINESRYSNLTKKYVQPKYGLYFSKWNNRKRTELMFNYFIDEETIYIYIPKMENIFSLQQLIRQLVNDKTKNLILDVRGNGGGNSNPVPEMLGDFVTEKTLLGSYIEKSGPQREDETNPVPIYAVPSEDYHFDIQVFVLINRGCYSATSYLAGMTNNLTNFTLVGQVTGGGGGGNAGFELSNGWALAISVSDFIDVNGITIENGVSPHISIENQASDISNRQDVMLEKVLELKK